MTCVIALKTDNGVIMGADSCISLPLGQGVCSVDEPKKLKSIELFDGSKAVFGITGSYGVISSLYSYLDVKSELSFPKKEFDNPNDFFPKYVLPFLVGVVNHASGWDKNMGGTIMIAVHDSIFLTSAVSGSLWWASLDDDYKAIGTGIKYAEKLLSKHSGKDPEKVVKKVLTKVAKKNKKSVKPPFIFESTI